MKEMGHAPEALARALERWVAGRLADAPGFRIDSLAAPQGGRSSETWMVRASWSGGAARRTVRWVLRVQARANQIYQDPSVARQFQVMQRLAGSEAPVPQALWLETDPAVIGAPFFLMEHVPGRTEPNLYQTQGVLFEATPAARERMWLSSLAAMAALHRTDPTDFSFLRYGDSDDGVEQELRRWDDYEAWAQLPGHPVLPRARKWLGDHRPKTSGQGLAWGDARLGNVVFRDDRCVALLDWETASLAGAETDLGWWLYYDHAITEGRGVPRLAGVGGRDATLAAWESFAGRKAQAMEWHEVFATWRFALISERAVALGVAAGRRSPADAGEGNPAIRRLLQLVGSPGRKAAHR
jgi:aminoglycoside phosphotransferase (APT) family kinase protein